MRALFQTQLSNYTTDGFFDLACDSGWNMVINRARQMLKIDPELFIDVMGPEEHQLIDVPIDVNPDVFSSSRVRYIEHFIIPNALITRYDFNVDHVVRRLDLKAHRYNEDLRYDFVYINDPMLLRHFRAMFFTYGGYLPKFFVHSHFVDCPNNPKFPVEASLWLGQCEAALKADYNFWQCQSAYDEFIDEMERCFQPELVHEVMRKSTPWDDGYSIEEMRLDVDESKIRFDIEAFRRTIEGKTVVFVPNRIGGKGRSSDYTQCGRFMFEILPELWKKRTDDGKKECDFVVIAGNPSQKFSNQELIDECGRFGFINLVDGTFNRDEYRWLAQELGKGSHIGFGGYVIDSYGGTASRELVEMGLMPAWARKFEYERTAIEASKKYPEIVNYLFEPDFSNAVDVMSKIIDLSIKHRERFVIEYQKIVRELCSFEKSTPKIYEVICNVLKK